MTNILTICMDAHQQLRKMKELGILRYQCCGLSFPDLYALEYHVYREH